MGREGARPSLTKLNENIMKTNTLLIIAASFGLLGAAHAEEGKKQRPHRKVSPEMIAKYDKDGDGKLNEEERAALRADRMEMREARKKEMLAKYDKDGDGKLNEEERAAAKADRKQRMLEKFDKDGDGELNEAEKAEMRKAMGPHRRHGGKGGKKRNRDGKGGAEKNEASAPQDGE